MDLERLRTNTEVALSTTKLLAPILDVQEAVVSLLLLDGSFLALLGGLSSFNFSFEGGEGVVDSFAGITRWFAMALVCRRDGVLEIVDVCAGHGGAKKDGLWRAVVEE